MTESSPFPPFSLPSAGSPPTQSVLKAETPAEKPARARKPKPEKAAHKQNEETPARSLKFDLQTVLAAAATLNADDYPLFEKVVSLLDEAGKPGRERLLAAIEKIFPR